MSLPSSVRGLRGATEHLSSGRGGGRGVCLRSVKPGEGCCRPGAALRAGGLGPACCTRAPGRPSAREGVRSLGVPCWGCEGTPTRPGWQQRRHGRGRDWGVFPVDQMWDLGPRERSPSWGIEPPFHTGHQASERPSTGGVGEKSPPADCVPPAPPHQGQACLPWLPAWTLAGP